jgi:hypothetical protein
MKMVFNVPVLTFLFLAAGSPCFAMMELAQVSKAQAQEMGVTIRTNLNGTSGVMVSLEFKPQGMLKDFTRVELEINADSRRLVDAPLQTSRSSADIVSAYFSTDPAYLATSTLMIVVQYGERSRTGYQFRLKDFIEPVKKAGAAPVYETTEQVQAMPPAKAAVELIETYSARLRAADGREFVIGSERGDQTVWHFVGTALKKGQTYEFPGAFRDFLKRKFYVTAEEVRAMPAVKATLEQRQPCSSIFRDAEGKQFVIGSPGSGPEVWQFLGTLQEEQTYDLPRAFLDYHQKKQR